MAMVMLAALFYGPVASSAQDNVAAESEENLVHEQADPAGKKIYWLGIQAITADPPLKSHLKLEAGLLVMGVVPEAPAQRAGIQKFDILMKYEDVQLRQVADLGECVACCEGKEASIEIIRAGKRQTLQLTPGIRPVDEFALPQFSGNTDMDRVRKWLRQFNGDEGMKFHFVRPGFALPPQQSIEIPDGVSITIHRHADKPTRITVKRGGESWEATEETIDQLPQDVRPLVKQFFDANRNGKLGSQGGHDWLKKFSEESAPPRESESSADFEQRFQRLLEKVDNDDALERMRRQLEELREEIRKLNAAQQDNGQ